MNKQHLTSAITLGFGITAILLLLLALPSATARANPGIYYARAGTSGDCLSPTTPCGSVQSAIDLALVPGDQVWVATGVYTENLTITYSVKLRGGWDASFTVQNPISTPTILDGSGAHVISAMAGSGPGTIDSLTIRNGRDGIHIYSGAYTLTHNLIYSTSRQGIEATTGDLRIESNTISHTSQEGISINGGTAIISDNLIFDTGLDGIRTDAASSNVLVHANTVYSTASDGIDSRGQTVVVTTNTVYHIGKDGIHIEDAGAADIRNNTVYSTTAYGIYARDTAFAVAITGNTIYTTGPNGDGIYVRGGNYTISDNTIHHTTGDGIRTHKSSNDVEIRANTIHHTGDDGIDARGATVTITGNILDDCADNGIKAEQAAHTLIDTNQVYGSGDAGIDLDDAGAFTVVNNIVVGSSAASVLIQTAAASPNLLAHNTLVGSVAGRQGDGISVTVAGVPIEIANNIVVSHNVGIRATAGANLNVNNTLRWANGDDSGSAATAILAPPRFVAPAQRDYHLLPNSPAIDAGTNAGISQDMDGQPRPIGPLPDIGADEFPAALNLSKQAAPTLVQPGAPLTYTIHLTNTGLLTLTGTISDVLPHNVNPAGTRAWAFSLAPDSVWAETIVVTVAADHIGSLVNVVRAATDQGPTGVYTHTLAPRLQVVKQANPKLVQAGERLTYTIRVTNTGNFHLSATISDSLPISITSARIPGGSTLLPGQQITWSAFIPAPGGVWTATVVVTTEADYFGPLSNVVQVTSAEGATGVYTEVSAAANLIVYLPVMARNHQDHYPGNLQNPGFEGIDCLPSPPGWCYGNWTFETHNGEYHDNIMTPQGWVTWWSEDSGYGQPEGKPIPNEPPYNGNPDRIRSGNYAAQLFTSFRSHDVGLYQVVNDLRPGSTVQFSAYAHGWSCDQDVPLGFSCGDLWSMIFYVGIEPNGVADPFSSNIVWSAAQRSPDYYSLIGPATAQVGPSGSVCVYIRSWAKWPLKHNDAYWDDTELITLSLGR